MLYWCIGGKPADASDRMDAKANDESDPLNLAVEIGKGRYSIEFLQAIDQRISETMALCTVLA